MTGFARWSGSSGRGSVVAGDGRRPAARLGISPLLNVRGEKLGRLSTIPLPLKTAAGDEERMPPCRDEGELSQGGEFRECARRMPL